MSTSITVAKLLELLEPIPNKETCIITVATPINGRDESDGNNLWDIVGIDGRGVSIYIDTVEHTL